MASRPFSLTVTRYPRTLHQEEILRPSAPIILGAGLIPCADYGLQTPTDLAGLRADLIKRLNAKLPRSGDLTVG
jgi:hypothetical protein